MLTLDVLICTINDGIYGIKDVVIPKIDGIRYVVSWQQCDFSAEIPTELQRDDITISIIHERGLSRNRNNAIDHSTGDICMIADDDVRYKPEYFQTVINAFEAYPDIDIATFKYASKSHEKQYPDYSFDFKESPKGYLISSIEIAFRRSSVAGKLKFNEHFGLGAPVLQSGEEGVFILDAKKMGLKGRYFPEVIAIHDDYSTATTRAGNPGVLMAEGAYIHLKFTDGTAPLRYILKAWRVSRNSQVSFFFALKYLLKGVTYIKKLQS